MLIFWGMEANEPDLWRSCVSYDTYFMDKMSPQRMVTNVAFDALEGVHGQTICWTEQQREILGAPFDQHMCIVAGAGCAKTTTLLGRILCLLRSGVPPQRIMLVTFSKDATEDMVERMTQWVGTEVPIVVGTFDALARRFLKANDEDSFNACQDVGDYKHAFLRFLQTSLSPHRQAVLSSVDYMLVDEYQDINSTYHDIIQTYAHHGTRVTAVGDDAQNIYTWNGSDIQYILEFGDTFNHPDATGDGVPVRTYYLTQNFRSTPEIIRVANASIARNTQQLPKTIEPTQPSVGLPVAVHVCLSWAQEARVVLPIVRSALNDGKTTAILCRNCTNHGPLYFFESQCMEHNIPCTLLERYRDHRSNRDKHAVTLCTIHKSKGLEWDVVVVVGCTEGHFPSTGAGGGTGGDSTGNVDEERRLFYVATTRAKSQLVFAASLGANTARRAVVPISRFIVEVPRSLFVWASNQPAPSTALHRGCQDSASTTSCVSLDKALLRLRQDQWCELREALSGLSGLSRDSRLLHPPVMLPEWVKTQHAHEDIERWCVHVLARMHTVPTLSAFTSWETTLRVSRREHRTYLRYKTTFDNLREDQEGAADDIAPDDLCAFHRLYQKCLTKADECGISASEVQITPRTNIPNAIRQRLVSSYHTFTDPQKEWHEVLTEAFEVSWVDALERGRMRMAHQHLVNGREALREFQPMMARMGEVFAVNHSPRRGRQRLLHRTRSMRLLQTLSADAVTVRAPLLVEHETGQWALLGVSLAESTQSTTHQCIQWLLEAVVCRRAGVCVSEVLTYYPHKGVLNVLDVSKESDASLEDV